MNKYDQQIDMTIENSISIILHRITPGSRVLEFGPATGYMTRYMKEEQGCTVYCIEVDKEAAQSASQYSEKMIVADVDQLGWVKDLSGQLFDHVIFADVLEHLRNPWKVLEHAVSFLKETGTLITSIPNIAHNAVLMDLLQGKFEYRRWGLLDNTHIRFFTKKSIIDMLEKADLCPVESLSTMYLPEHTEFEQSYYMFPEPVQKYLQQKQDGHVYQYITVSKKKQYVTDEELNNNVSIKSMLNWGFLQVFWETNGTFEEQNSTKAALQHGDDFIRYDILLTNNKIGRLRIDPCNRPAYVEIKSISLYCIDENGQMNQNDYLFNYSVENHYNKLIPYSGIVELGGEEIYKFISVDHDPQIILENGYHEGNSFVLQIEMKISEKIIEPALSKIDFLKKHLMNIEHRLIETFAQLNTTEEELKNKQLEVNLKVNKLWILQEEMIAKDNQLFQLTSELVANKEQLKLREEDLVNNANNISSLQLELFNKEQIQAKYEQELTQKIEYQNYLQSEIDKRDILLNSIYNSRAWKFVEKYRKINYVIKGLKRKLNYSYEVSRTPKWNAKQQRWTINFSFIKWVRQVLKLIRSRIKVSRVVLYDVKIKEEISTNRPKIIHAIPNTFVGGSTQLIVDLIEYLGHKYDMEIITSALPKDGEIKGVKIHVFSQIKSQEEIVQFLKEQKADLVHIHYWGLDDTPWYDKVFQAMEFHDCKAVENINTPIKAYEHSEVDQYVFVSEYAQKMYGLWPENSSVIYPGSDFTHFKPKHTKDRPDAVGMVYRLEPDKLREDAIQVFIELVRKRPKTLVYIVGMGSFFEKYINQVYEANVRDNFIFTGYVPYSELPEVYDKFSVFVAPVWKESFGQVSPFAMSKEIVVTGYNVGALSEILNDTDTLASSLDELVDKLVYLLDNQELLEQKSQQYRKRAQEFFSVESMVSKYDDLYTDLLSKKG